MQSGEPPIPEGEPLREALDLFFVDDHIVRTEVVLRRFLETGHLGAETVEDPDGEVVELAVDRDPVLGVGDIRAGRILARHEQGGGDRLQGGPLGDTFGCSLRSDLDVATYLAIGGVAHFYLVLSPIRAASGGRASH